MALTKPKKTVKRVASTKKRTMKRKIQRGGNLDNLRTLLLKTIKTPAEMLPFSSIEDLINTMIYVNLEHYNSFIQDVGKVYQDKFKKNAFWCTLFAARCEGIVSNRQLVNNSANCSFTLMPVMLQGTNLFKSFFVKIVDFPIKNTDHILLDNVNGWILNQFTDAFIPGIKNHVMEYIDSFVGYTKDRKYWDFSTQMDISSLDSPFNLNSSSYFNKVYVSISTAVHGMSLNNLLQSYIQNPNLKGFCDTIVNTKMMELVNVLTKLGLEWGMLHNDLHFGNILINKDNDSKLVMIDYGRLHFQRFADADEVYNKNLNTFIQREFKKLCIDDDPKLNYLLQKYEGQGTIIDKLGDENMKSTGINNNLEYFFHITDMITLACNMYVFYLITQQNNRDIIIQLQSFVRFNANPSQLLSRDISITFSTAIDDRINQYKAVYDKLGSSPNAEYLKYMIEGLFYFTWFLSKENKFSINLYNESSKYFYHHFQYIGNSKDLVDKLPKMNEEITSKLTSVQVEQYFPFITKLQSNTAKKSVQVPISSSQRTISPMSISPSSPPGGVPPRISGGKSRKQAGGINSNKIESFGSLSYDIDLTKNTVKQIVQYDYEKDENYIILKNNIELDKNSKAPKVKSEPSLVGKVNSLGLSRLQTSQIEEIVKPSKSVNVAIAAGGSIKMSQKSKCPPKQKLEKPNQKPKAPPKSSLKTQPKTVASKKVVHSKK